MAEKTYVADVAFESVAVGDKIISEETQRLSALLGVGYIHEMSGPVYAVTDVEFKAALTGDDDENDLLETFEEQDVVETGEPVASKRRTRKE